MAATRVAIVGATGAVGQEILQVMKKRAFPYASLKLLASHRSAGRQYEYEGKTLTVEEVTTESFHDVDVAFFSASGGISKQFVSSAVESGAVVVDNTSAFRMDPDTPLVVPEVNPHAVKDHSGVIANPNCTTIIMTLPVFPLHSSFGVKRIVLSTYQAASGAGAAAMEELEQQAVDWVGGKRAEELQQDIFGRQYLWNVFSHNSAVDMDTLYNEEETKAMRETAKIFGDDSFRNKVSATCVRVPVLRAHCEAINLTLEKPATLQQVRDVLAGAPGVKIVDDPENNKFPEPLDVSGEDDVLVGRIRPDPSQPEGLGYDLFISGDQILKGAALNAVQIAELL